MPTLSTTTPNSSPVNDAGYWPYLTLLFALLWLATSLFTWWQWQHTKHPQQVGSNHSEPSSAYQILLQAIEQQDLLAISQAMRIWQSQIILNQDEHQRLTALLYPLQQACYSEQPQTPDFSELKHWIMVKQKQQCKRTRQQEAELPQL